MEQIVEMKAHVDATVAAEEQILELSLDLLQNVGGGAFAAKL
jgi:hypothetical protein